MTTLNKEQLANAYKKVWGEDTKMIDYCVKTSSVNYVTDDGIIWDIDKPRIETRFCFGEHGYDYNEVNKTCQALSEDERYFKAENMRRMEARQIMDSLTEHRDKAYWVRNYRDSDFHNIRFDSHYDQIERYNPTRKMTQEEIDDVLELLKKEVEKFDKRLNTYLKRYGLSKCDFWTYWADR